MSGTGLGSGIKGIPIPIPIPIPTFFIRGFPIPVPIPGQPGDSPVKTGAGFGFPIGYEDFFHPYERLITFNLSPYLVRLSCI